MCAIAICAVQQQQQRKKRTATPGGMDTISNNIIPNNNTNTQILHPIDYSVALFVVSFFLSFAPFAVRVVVRVSLSLQTELFEEKDDHKNIFKPNAN